MRPLHTLHDLVEAAFLPLVMIFYQTTAFFCCRTEAQAVTRINVRPLPVVTLSVS